MRRAARAAAALALALTLAMAMNLVVTLMAVPTYAKTTNVMMKTKNMHADYELRRVPAQKINPNTFLVSAATASALKNSHPDFFDTEPFVAPTYNVSAKIIVLKFKKEATLVDLSKLKQWAPTVKKVTPKRVAVFLNSPADFFGVLKKINDNFDLEHVSPVFDYEKHATKELEALWGSGKSYGLFLRTNSTVGISDTGIDTNHCAFFSANDPPHQTLNDAPLSPVESTRSKVRTYIRVCSQITMGTCTFSTDFVDVSAGHGTAMASVLGANLCAMEHGSVSGKLVFFDLHVSGPYLQMPIHFGDMYQTSLNYGAKTFSASWGAGCYNIYDDAANQIDAFVRDNPDFLMVVSAGNCGNSAGYNGMASPAIAKNVLSVAASMSSPVVYFDGSQGFDSSDVAANPTKYAFESIASFSSVGPLKRNVPLVAAPGVGVAVALAGTTADYGTVSGTSPAAQVAAGIAETLRVQLQHPKAATIRAAMVAIATPAQRVVRVSGSTVTVLSDNPNTRVGFGTVVPSAHTISDFKQLSVESLNVVSVCFVTGEESRVAIAWDDPPAAAGSAKPLVNELFVIVLQNAQLQLHKHDLDDDNNHKRFLLGAGTYRMSVSSALMTSAQDFSVVATSGNFSSCETSCSWLDSPEPLPCAISNGVGLKSCTNNTLECRPHACDAGYVFGEFASKAACVLGSVGVSTCDSYAVWNKTQCVCAGAVLCMDGTLLTCVDGALSGTCAVSAQEYESPVVAPPALFVTQDTSPILDTVMSVAVVMVSIVGVLITITMSIVAEKESFQYHVVYRVFFITSSVFCAVGVGVRVVQPVAAYILLLLWLVLGGCVLVWAPQSRVWVTLLTFCAQVLFAGIADYTTPNSAFDPFGGSGIVFLVGIVIVVFSTFFRGDVVQSNIIVATFLTCVAFAFLLKGVLDWYNGSASAGLIALQLVVAVLLMALAFAYLWGLFDSTTGAVASATPSKPKKSKKEPPRDDEVEDPQKKE